LIKGKDLRKVFIQCLNESCEECSVGLDSVGVLGAYPNNPGIQEAFEIRGAEEYLFVIFHETCT
jgi:hypothetical protein